jgi:hypothetical protein
MRIDMASVDPCALVTREEAEVLMGPLDWKPTPHDLNDPTFWLKCDYDAPFSGDTPNKSLAVRVIAPDMWPAFFDHLQDEGTSRVPRQDVGLAAEAAVRYELNVIPLLPELCDLELPCVIADEGTQRDWLTLTVIMADRSAIQIGINPRNVDYTSQLARTILERLPLK